MTARHIDDRDGTADLDLVPRFVVLITNPRLVEGRFARMAVRDAARGLPEVPFFTLDEDAEDCQRWLASLNLPVIADGRAPGTGSLLWLSRGRVVEFSSREQRLDASQIIAKTRFNFHLDSETLEELSQGMAEDRRGADPPGADIA